MSDYVSLEDVETEWPGLRRANMIDWQNRVYEVLIDPDSEEIDAAMTQLFGALHDTNSAWHTQAIQVLRQLYEHFSFPGKSWDARSWYDDMAVIDEESEHFAEGW